MILGKDGSNFLSTLNEEFSFTKYMHHACNHTKSKETTFHPF
jgi:hypothetical protein